MEPFPVHLILGATASGKSQRAVTLAQQRGGVIINADATQCYADLQILSARPDSEELAQAEHQLYGIWAGSKHASVADWLEVAVAEIQRCWDAEKLPILCGGTGMYLKVLRGGISPIPSIPAEIRQQMREQLERQGHEALHRHLQQVDSHAAAKIPPQNTQRLLRALEVHAATGTPLSQWQDHPTLPPLPQANFQEEIITLPRDQLYQRIDARLKAMVKRGALEEVKTLIAKGYAPDLPVMKAVGVPEFSAYLRGEIDWEEALRLAQRNSRHYAKRQLTWLRNQNEKYG